MSSPTVVWWNRGLKMVGAAAALLALLIVAKETHNGFANPGAGVDFQQVREAALALRHGHSIYAAGPVFFAYPPTAAVIFLPFGFGTYSTALHAMLILDAAAVVVALVAALAPSRSRYWPLLAAITVILVVKGDAFNDTLALGNIGLLLAPIAVFVLLSFEEDQWTLGCALLAVSLLIKPLLVPFLLLPMFYRQWRPLMLTILPAALLVALAVVTVPGGHGFFSTARKVVAGSGGLRGTQAVYNISLFGLADQHHATGAVLDVGRALIAAAAIGVVVVWLRRPRSRGDIAAMGAFVLLVVMLAGSLSEEHYLLVVGPCLLLALTLRREATLFVWAAPGFLLLIVARYYLGDFGATASGVQIRFFVAELLLIIAAAAALLIDTPRFGRS